MSRPNRNTKFKGVLHDPEHGFYIEDYFIERLRLERQRTERSKKPFMMMLLNITKVPKKERKQTIRGIADVVFSSTRETDLRGWYRYDSMIGVLLTEIGDIDRDSLRNKIWGNLCDRLGLAHANRVEISFHIFPNDPDGSGDQDQSSSDHRIFYPDLTRPDMSQKAYFATKRMMDIFGSLAGIIILSPVFLVIAAMIRLSSPGPIVFKQERVGLYGRRFTFLKFRSMYVNNDPSVHKQYVTNLITGQNGNAASGNGSRGNGVYKITNDVRVTPIGRLLRRSSFDEFPQLLNVLKGDMSLVGPRPPIPYELEKYETWHRRRVLEVKPGLSGLWQVEGRSRTTFDEMVRLDLKYMKERCLWMDIKILLHTPWAVVRAKGAY